MRVFCFSEGDYTEGFGGGGKGVAYRLYMANGKYGLIPEMYFIFGDTLIEANGQKTSYSEDAEICSGGVSGLMKLYSILDDRLSFSSDDIFIFHDFTCFYALKNLCNHIDRTAVIYHGQGSVFHEAKIYGLKADEEYREKAFRLTQYVLSKAQVVCFPSDGAKEAFMATSEDEISQLLNLCKVKTLYNGCRPEISDSECVDKDLLSSVSEWKQQGKRIFASIAVLNEAKGVERLPAFFKEYGKYNDYKWIVIGNGVMAGRLSEEIKDIEDHVLWIKEPVSHETIINLYAEADYYILAHRLSIFDFATIEAMHMGMIPVLTDVGGNKEMICDDNGFFLTCEPGDGSRFASWEASLVREELSRKNKEIALKRFSDKSMLEAYRDLIVELKQDEGSEILVITPDLELNGAQVVLNELLDLPFFSDRKIDLISPSKGPYGSIYEEKGIRTLIRPYIAGDSAFREHLIRDYKMVFINTSSCSKYLMFFVNTDVPVFYWLHETFTQLGMENNTLLDPRLLSSNIRFFGVTGAVLEGINKRYGKVSIKLLPMPVADVSNEPADLDMIPQDILDRIDGKILFFLPAAYTYIKGQDVLIQAIAQLPKEYREKAHFVLCGYSLPGQSEYLERLRRLCGMIPEITMLDSLSREEVYLWYKISDCVLAPSRVDATPTSIVEAMMFGRIVLVSDATGISKYLTDCVNAFVFPSENVEELMKRIMLIISEYGQLDAIGERGRLVYEANYSPKHVQKILEKEAEATEKGI